MVTPVPAHVRDPSLRAAALESIAATALPVYLAASRNFNDYDEAIAACAQEPENPTGGCLPNDPAVAAVAIIIICSYAVAANQARIADVGGWVIAAVILLNAAGYVTGWWLARLFVFDAMHRLTLAIEIGMQNAGLGVALALRHFAPETALPGALFAFWCILTAAGASSWLRRRDTEPVPGT